MEAAHDEDRQRHERRPDRASDDIGGRRQFADVKLDIAHHAPESPDLRLHVNEIGVDSTDRNAPFLERGRVRIIRHRNFQRQGTRQKETPSNKPSAGRQYCRTGHCAGEPTQ